MVIPVPKDRARCSSCRGAARAATHQFTYIGTTDTDYDGPIDDPQITPDDIAYLLRAINGAVDDDDHRGRHPRHVGRAAAARRRGQERTHRRPLAPPLGARVAERRGHRHRRQAHDVPAHGRRRGRRGRRRCSGTARPQPHEAHRACTAPTAGTRRDLPPSLAERYGGDARDVSRARARPTPRWPTADRARPRRTPRAEVVYAVRAEMARTVDDVLSRRTRARLLARDASAAAADDVAALMAAELGWSRRRARPPGRGSTARWSTTERAAGGLPETALDALLAPARPDSVVSAAMQTNRGAPTPPIAFADAATSRDHLADAGASRSTTRLASTPRGDRRRRDRRAPRTIARGEPRLVAARDDLGARRAGRGARVGRRAAARRRRGRGRAARCATRRASRSPRPRAAAACAARACPCSAACCSTSPRSTGIVGVDHDVDARRRAARAPSATCSKTSCAPSTASPAGTGRSRWRSRPSAAGSRAAAPVSSRRATARSRTSSRASTSCSPTARSSTPAARRAPRSGPISRSCSSAPRARSASSSARGCALHPLPPAEIRGAYAFASFADGLDAMRRIVQRGATPAVLRLYDAIEADRSYQTGDAHVLLDARRGRRAHRRRDAPHRRRGVRGGRADRRRARRAWMEHRNDVSALEALISRGFVVDTMEVAALVARAARRSTTRTTEAIRGVEHTMVASAHQSHSYPDGACLYFTFAGRPPEDEREAYYRAVWDAGQRAVLAAGGALSHHHGVGLNRARFVAEALGAGLRRAAVGEGRARPERHPQPGQARPRRARSARSRGREPSTGRVLVVDVGTSSVRAAVVRRRRRVRRTAYERELLPDSPADGLVRVRRRR